MRVRRYILHPISTGRLVWDYGLRFLVLATLVVVPLRLAFVYKESQGDGSTSPLSFLIIYADVALDACRGVLGLLASMMEHNCEPSVRASNTVTPRLERAAAL